MGSGRVCGTRPSSCGHTTFLICSIEAQLWASLTSAAAHGLKSSRQPHVGPAAGIDQQYPRDLPVVGCLLRPASLSLSALRSARSSGGISETRSLSPTTAGERGLGLVTAIARILLQNS